MRTLTIWLGALVLAVAVQAQDFTRTMTAEEQAAAGLEKLSPEELARLKAFVERYKAGAVATVQEQAEQKVAATEAKAKEAEQKAAAAEAKAKEVAAQQGEERKSGPGWLRALVTLKKAEQNPAGNEPLESRLVGDFRGWRRGTVFELENGQRWQHVEGEDYVTPPMPPPRVKITPGAFGTFWMKIEGVNARLRVKPIKLE